MDPNLRKIPSTAFYVHIAFKRKLLVKVLGKHANFTVQDDFSEEQVQDAICKMLSEEIRCKLNALPQIKQNFDKSMNALHGQNLDMAQFDEQKARLINKLKSQYKLHFALDNVDNMQCGLDQACWLMAIYMKLADYEQQADGSMKKTAPYTSYQLQKSITYRYINAARIEAGYPKSLTRLSYARTSDLAEQLYISSVICDCDHNLSAVGKYIRPDSREQAEQICASQLTDDNGAPFPNDELAVLVNQGFESKFAATIRQLNSGLSV